jgi:hypothetical protein
MTANVEEGRELWQLARQKCATLLEVVTAPNVVRHLTLLVEHPLRAPVVAAALVQHRLAMQWLQPADEVASLQAYQGVVEAFGPGDWCVAEDLPGPSLVADYWRVTVHTAAKWLRRPGATAGSWAVAATYLRQVRRHRSLKK